MHEPPAELEGFPVVSGGVLAPRGFVGGGVAAGIKPGGKLDLGAILSICAPCISAATFTTNRVRGASVDIDQERMKAGPVRGVVFNSGNANTYTGDGGYEDAIAFINAFAKKFNVPHKEILVASTGVIGFRLPMDKVFAGVEALKLTVDGGDAVALAMLTTDVGPKTVAIDIPLSNGVVRIGGVAKGAGMVHPNMATMFAFLTTDAQLSESYACRLFRSAVAASFNLISVDGDQSTSDTALLLANGESRVGLADTNGHDARLFSSGLFAVCHWLARELVRGGEGVTRVIEVRVSGAPDVATARQAARKITSSNLVKTAIHGGDPNWGRVVMALGNSGVDFDPNNIDISIGDTQVVAIGEPITYEEADVAAHFKEKDVRIGVSLNRGESDATAWGGDLSAEYVAINSEYMT
jgi:glutamate N-acetyltransferase/amino-acid N-acetyltransferase